MKQLDFLNILYNKKCSSCKKEKAIDKFSLNKLKKDGRSSRCRSCKSKKEAKRKKRIHKERKKLYDSYRDDDYAVCCVCKERKLIRGNFNFAWNKADALFSACIFCNGERKKTEKGRKYRREYSKRPYVRIIKNNSSRMRAALDVYGLKKNDNSLNYVGCNGDFFVEHLISQFEDGMSLSNYGEWEIDHIKPLAYFDLENEENRYVAFHWSNCRPLWKQENNRKSSFYKGKKYYHNKKCIE